MFCKKCGNELTQGDIFCSRCGMRFTESELDQNIGHKKHQERQEEKIQETNVRYKNGLKLPPKRIVRIKKPTEEELVAARVNAKIKSELARAGKIGNGLGSLDALEEKSFWASDGVGCLLSLLCCFNPLTIAGRDYKSKAKAALAEGNLDLANQYREKASQFCIAGVVTSILLGIVIIVVGVTVISEWLFGG